MPICYTNRYLGARQAGDEWPIQLHGVQWEKRDSIRSRVGNNQLLQQCHGNALWGFLARSRRVANPRFNCRRYANRPVKEVHFLLPGNDFPVPIMADPHVASVRYRLEASEGTTFDNPPPVHLETMCFKVTLADGVATFEMKEHYPDVEAARKAIEPFLRAWGIDAALRMGGQEISFRYQDVQVIDRDPPAAGSHHIMIGSVQVTVRVAGTMQVTRHRYPEPPQRFRVSPDVETLWHRYEGYLNQREPLLSMAYFCLTVVEYSAGGRPMAARKYCISKYVLDKLGALTALGDERMARKKIGKSRPLTATEMTWIEAVIKAMIRRVGEVAARSSSLAQITMADLSDL
jgi:hypothetical protein